jgi:hypothetical protein
MARADPMMKLNPQIRGFSVEASPAEIFAMPEVRP